MCWNTAWMPQKQPPAKTMLSDAGGHAKSTSARTSWLGAGIAQAFSTVAAGAQYSTKKGYDPVPVGPMPSPTRQLHHHRQSPLARQHGATSPAPLQSKLGTSACLRPDLGGRNPLMQKTARGASLCGDPGRHELAMKGRLTSPVWSALHFKQQQLQSTYSPSAINTSSSPRRNLDRNRYTLECLTLKRMLNLWDLLDQCRSVTRQLVLSKAPPLTTRLAASTCTILTGGGTVSRAAASR